MIPGKIPEATRTLSKPLNRDEKDGNCEDLAIADVILGGDCPAMLSMW